jgi:threonine dehydratase
MPSTAPAAASTPCGYGAEVVFYDQLGEAREALAARLAAERGATLVRHSITPRSSPGQATAAYELFKDEGHHDVLWCRSEAAGCCRVRRSWRGAGWYDVRVYGVEPAAAGRRGALVRRRPDREHRSSGHDRRRRAHDVASESVRSPVIRELVSGILTVTDDEIVDAMRFAFERMKLVDRADRSARARGAARGQGPGERPGRVTAAERRP